MVIMSLVAAASTALVTFIVVFLLACKFALGDLGILLDCVLTITVGIGTFVLTFRKFGP